MPTLIPVTQSKYTLVDDAFVPIILSVGRSWYACRSRYTWYAVCKFNGSRISMHRLILGFPATGVVDHKNRNGLDNRFCNLQNITDHENRYNKRRYSNNSSGVPGVYYSITGKGRKFWHAQISRSGNQILLGRFVTFEEAVAARLEAENAYANS